MSCDTGDGTYVGKNIHSIVLIKRSVVWEGITGVSSANVNEIDVDKPNLVKWVVGSILNLLLHVEERYLPHPVFPYLVVICTD